MTIQEAIKTLTNEAGNALTKALTELDQQGVSYLIAEAGRSLLTQCLYALQGRLDDIRQSDLEWACQQAKIRPPDRQKITWTLRSNHISGNAVDIIPLKNGRPDWNNQDDRIVAAMKSAGFTWGGDWPPPNTDPPHFEIRR